MQLTEAQYERIAPLLPVQRGNVNLSDLHLLAYDDRHALGLALMPGQAADAPGGRELL